MIERLWCGKPAEIAFTCDFHELVTGELSPGGPVLLRYDPLRIIPPDEDYRFGDAGQPVIAHLRFHPEGTPLDVRLHSPAGVIACPDVDVTGQGAMLQAELVVPADAELLVVWFSYRSAAGSLLYDSDYGANFRFGFAGREIGEVQATVVRRPDEGSDRFDISLNAGPSVQAVSVPFLIVGDAGVRHEIGLQRVAGTAEDPGTADRWSGSADVPREAVVRFKICYWIGGRRLIDDNASAWYLAPAPSADRPPPPRPALLTAAAAWR
ncbi:MAG: DUF6209 family protein [Rhodospirillales bacterium]